MQAQLLLVFIVLVLTSCSSKQNELVIYPAKFQDYHVIFFNGCDTLRLPLKEKGKDTVQTEIYLRFKKPITIDELEYFCHSNNIRIPSLREDIYWLNKLSKAKIKTVTNAYGDFIGYQAISGSQYIPVKYWNGHEFKGVGYSNEDESINCVIELRNYKHDSNDIRSAVNQLTQYDWTLITENEINGVSPADDFGVYVHVYAYVTIQIEKVGTQYTIGPIANGFLDFIIVEALKGHEYWYYTRKKES